ncbi:MAG TPA: DUF222 domain-containing protein [Actinomycetes bacterium]|nr:DUF222 domain-containing protein [Actinomycetes bacterium]
MQVLNELAAITDRLAALDVAAMSGSEAQELAAGIGGVMSRLAGVRAAALANVSSSGSWALDGSRSMPAALARSEDTTLGTQRGDLAFAETLREHLPLTAAALCAGRLSLDKAKLLARHAPTSPARIAALEDPETGEAFLLDKAAELDCWAFSRALRYWGYRVDPDADDRSYAARERSRDGYWLELADTTDGTDISGFVSHESGELLRTALRAITGVPDAGDTRTPRRRAADALTAMARFALDSGQHARDAVVRPHLNVTVDYPTLVAAAHAAGVDPATLTNTQTPIPRVVLDRIACDAEVTRIVFGPASEPLDVGRARRTVTPQQRRAVIARDEHCTYPGCHAPPRMCEVHHVIPWALGGPTSVANSILLCWAHHDHAHAQDLTITRSGDQWRFRRPERSPLRR